MAFSLANGLSYAFLEASMNKIALWKNVRVDDWTAERAFITGNVSTLIWSQKISIGTKINCLYVVLY